VTTVTDSIERIKRVASRDDQTHFAIFHNFELFPKYNGDRLHRHPVYIISFISRRNIRASTILPFQLLFVEVSVIAELHKVDK